ncbi:MAG: hypothetical protein CL946_02675 [Ectothiorhodospiraceae bacterium]|nr:hypothetical protein [Ectothiorhodospiraceae bacterium]
MDFQLSEENIQKIGGVLGAEPKKYSNYFRFEMQGEDENHRAVVEIHPSIPIGKSEGALVTVFTPNTNLQLQHCSGVVLSEMMGEVTFVAEYAGKITGIILEKGGSCSMYANVDREMLSGDFTQLAPEVMLSGVALSLTEVALPEPGSSEQPGAGA